MYGTIKSMFGAMVDADGSLYGHMRQILRQVCDKESNCIDISAGRGRALNIMMDAAPLANIMFLNLILNTGSC